MRRKKMGKDEIRKLKENLLTVSPTNLELYDEKMTKKGLMVMWNIIDKKHILYQSTITIWIKKKGGR